MNLTDAARIVGYRSPDEAGSRLKKKWPKMYAAAEVKWKNRLLMDAHEVDERLAAVARDPKHKDHFNALKTLAQMHGKLDNKLVMQFDRAALNQQLDEMIEAMAQAKAASSSAQASPANPLPERITERTPNKHAVN